jgi:AmiR/NasT family two-component response regulator
LDDSFRVLIAEDETIIRLDLKQLLEQAGHFVCGEARDGLEAVSLARETEPDIAILDVKMPNLDGIEAARRIYAERPIPIVMLTAYSDPPLVERAIAAGVFGYLVKPFRDGDVLPAVHAAVARHRELFASRRDRGRGGTPIEVEVRSSTGQVIPLRLRRSPDGTLNVTLGDTETS